MIIGSVEHQTMVVKNVAIFMKKRRARMMNASTMVD